MGVALLIGMAASLTMAQAVLPRAGLASPAAPAVIAEVQAALDKGDAQRTANLADSALKEEGVTTGERGRLLRYRGLGQDLWAHLERRDFTQALDIRVRQLLPPAEPLGASAAGLSGGPVGARR